MKIFNSNVTSEKYLLEWISLANKFFEKAKLIILNSRINFDKKDDNQRINTEVNYY